MYVEFNSEIVGSEDIKNIIEKNTEFKVLKDMSKGSKREDILAFNLSVDINTLNDLMEEECDLSELQKMSYLKNIYHSQKKLQWTLKNMFQRVLLWILNLINGINQIML